MAAGPVLLPAGIDVDGSRHVTISDAEVDTADDAICLKTVEAGRPLEHVAVHDCRWAGAQPPLLLLLLQTGCAN